MCGRFTQRAAEVQYLLWLKSQAPVAGTARTEPIDRYNVPPRSRVQILHQDDDGLRFSPVLWGYAPFWARGKRAPSINARLETAATSRFWSGIWKSGRCLVPADGWYEWVKDENDPKIKQPYYIRLKSEAPMFFAGIGQFARGEAEPVEDDGFAIITSDSDQGMVDIHDRRPVVLPPDVAREWLEPGLAPERAEDLARHHAAAVDQFEWYKVDRAVGNVRNQGSHLIQPIG